MIYRATANDAQVLDKKRRVIRHIGTNEVPDRYRSILLDSGWRNLDAFLTKNPVHFWAHDSRSMPIGSVIDILPTTIKAKDLLGNDGVFKARFFDVEYPDRKTYPFGFLCFDMYRKRFLRGSSVGFEPVQVDRIEDEAELTRLGIGGKMGEIFRSMDLLEFSAAPIPGNQEALAQQLTGYANEFRLGDVKIRSIGAADEHFDEWFAEAMEMLKRSVDTAGGAHVPQDARTLIVDADPAAGEALIRAAAAMEPTAEEATEAEKDAIETANALQHAELVAEESARTGEVNRAASSQIQTFIFSKKNWTVEKAKKWLGDHGKKNGDVDETSTSYRFRQFDPSECVKGSYVSLTENFPAGMTAVSCKRGRAYEVPAEEAERAFAAKPGDAARAKAKEHESMARMSREEASRHGTGTMKGDHRSREAAAHEELAKLHNDHGAAMDKHAESSDANDAAESETFRKSIETKEGALSTAIKPFYGYAANGDEITIRATPMSVQAGVEADDSEEELSEDEALTAVLEAHATLDQALVALADVMRGGDGATEEDELGEAGDETGGKKPPAPVAPAKTAPPAKTRVAADPLTVNGEAVITRAEFRAEMKRFLLDLPSADSIRRLEAELAYVRELAESPRGRQVGAKAPTAAAPQRDALGLLAQHSLDSLQRTAEALGDLATE